MAAGSERSDRAVAMAMTCHYHVLCCAVLGRRSVPRRPAAPRAEHQTAPSLRPGEVRATAVFLSPILPYGPLLYTKALRPSFTAVVLPAGYSLPHPAPPRPVCCLSGRKTQTLFARQEQTFIRGPSTVHSAVRMPWAEADEPGLPPTPSLTDKQVITGMASQCNRSRSPRGHSPNGRN